jgi:hypothetical protein
VDLEHDLQQPSRLGLLPAFGAGQAMILARGDGELAHQGDAILPLALDEVGAEDMMPAQLFRQGARLIDALAPPSEPHVDFLERHEIRPSHDVRDPLQVELAVGPLRVMDVEGRELDDVVGLRPVGRGSRDKQADEPGDLEHEFAGHARLSPPVVPIMPRPGESLRGGSETGIKNDRQYASALMISGCRVFGCKPIVLMLHPGVGWGSYS